VVGILCMGDASSSWCIIGRLVTPGTDQAADAVSLENSRTTSANVDDFEATSSLDYGDLETVGPSVDIVVPASGTLLVRIEAQIVWQIGVPNTPGGGYASVAMSGANTTTADDWSGVVAYSSTANSQVNFGFYSSGRTLRFTGLNPGTTTLTMKYRSFHGEEVLMGNRVIVAQAL
jgi:hypothetical protein